MGDKLEGFELDLLLKAIEYQWGYDFRRYAQTSIQRRVKNIMLKHQIAHVSELIPLVLHDPGFFQNMVFDFSITVTEMFRDPVVWRRLVDDVFDRLKTWPFFKIWHAGCATGEEVWSMAILLKEAGLLERATIYATDFNDVALYKGRQGVYLFKDMQAAQKNYQAAGGKFHLSAYYTVQGESVVFDKSLGLRIVWANHNLTTDYVFGEMNFIMCRNALIYFNASLQNQVLSLFTASLSQGGFLCLGSKESLDFYAVKPAYEPISLKDRIWCKATLDEDGLSPTVSITKTPPKGVVVMACSIENVQSVRKVLDSLHESFALPILITQQLSPAKQSLTAHLLQSHCFLPVKDASNGEMVELGCVYVVPAHYHLSVKDDRTLVLSSAGRYVYAQSSVDAMFFSVAHAGLACVMAVVLSALHYEKLEGLAAIRRTGGIVVVESSLAANKVSHPRLVMDKSLVDEVLPAEEMAHALFKYVNRFV